MDKRPARSWLPGHLACLLLLLASNSPADERLVAVTFDDLPIAGGDAWNQLTRRNLTLRLLLALSERNIPATGFVNESGLVIDDEISEERVNLLRLWLATGFDLGNHTYSHPDLHRVPVDQFTDDIGRGEKITRRLLAETGGRVPEYFRHPYLHTGRTLETRRAIESYLAGHGYQVAPVTIDNSEWIFARAYTLATLAGDLELAARIGREYVEYMLQMFAWYEVKSQQLFGRNIRHVLLLHANLLNSDWFDKLADELAGAGYQFIELRDALTDPAYRSADTYTGPGGITWLQRWALSRQLEVPDFVDEPKTPAFILELAGQREHNYSSEP